MSKIKTVGQLRKALKGVPDNMSVLYFNQDGVVDYFEELDVPGEVYVYQCDDGSGSIHYPSDVEGLEGDGDLSKAFVL